MAKNNPSEKTIIIGAGPAGSSVAIYLARYNHPVILIDAGIKVHGRTSMATTIENFLGHRRKTSGTDFLARIDKQLARFPISRISEKVLKVSQNNQGQFLVITDTGKKYQAQYLVVAVGLIDKMPEISGLDPYYDHSIFHCLTCDWYQNRHKKIAVIGNGDSAITTALAINSMQKPPKLAAVPAVPTKFSKKMVQKAKKNQIAVFSSPITKLKGRNGYLQKIQLKDGTKVEAEVLFTELGYVHLDGFLARGGLKPKRDEDGFLKVNFETFETSVKNLYATGPVNEGPDQAIVAGGEGALAAISIHAKILKQKGI